MKRVIGWEKWVNPLGGGEEYMAVEDLDDYDDDEIDFDDEEKNTAVRPVIPTAGGLMPVSVYGNFGVNFNFWMMHTNFNFSKKKVNILRKVPGVETLDVITRYRARIGFGKMFKSSAVKFGIQDAMDAQPPAKNEENPGNITLDADCKTKVAMLEDAGKEKFKFWVIYVMPNGQVSFSGTDSEEGYADRLELYRQSQELAGGIIFTSDEQ